MNDPHPLIDAFTVARIADLTDVVGTENIALVDATWAAAIVLTSDLLAHGDPPSVIREALLLTWHQATDGASRDWNTALVGNTWARVLVAFDRATRRS